MDITIEKLNKHSDEKGFLVEFLTEKDIKNNKGFGHMFFVNFKNKKTIRGNHYHKIQHEYYTIVHGQVKVVLQDINAKKKKTVILSANGKDFKRLRIGPYVAHASYSLTPTALLLSYYKFPYDSQKPDSVPFEVIKL